MLQKVSESNNTVTKEFFIYEDEAKTAFHMILQVGQPVSQSMYYASTANSISTMKQYVMELRY